MMRYGLGAVLVVAGMGLAAMNYAEDGEKKGDKKSNDVEAKSAPRENAATIDFRKDLGLSFNSLDLLGFRIEMAREDADPVGLASAARELAVAEKVSGKHAALTAEELLNEAIALGKLRDISKELAALAEMTSGDTSKELAKLSASAKKREEKIAMAAKAGDAPKGIYHQLIVHNFSEVVVRVYVQGRYVGHVHPFDHEHFHMHEHGHLDLDAFGPGHEWHHHQVGEVSNFTWRLLD